MPGSRVPAKQTTLQLTVFAGPALRRRLVPGTGLEYDFLPLASPTRVDLGSADGVVHELASGTQKRRVSVLRRKLGERPLLSLSRRVDADLLRRSRALGFDDHLVSWGQGDPPAHEVRARVNAAAAARRERERLENDSARNAKRLEILTGIVRTANSILEPRKIVELVLAQIQRLVPAEALAVLMVDESRQTLRFELAQGGRAKDVAALELQMGEGIAGWVAQSGEPALILDTEGDPRFSRRFDEATRFETRSVLCVPLVSRGRTIGVVQAINRLAGCFSESDLELMMTLVEPCAIAIENAMLFQRAEQLTITDDLTRLFNSRYLNLYMTRELKRCKRHGIPLSVIFLDLDGFKAVNDAHGHLAGSATLTEVGEILSEAVRETDVLARYGGDEFVVVLPETPASGALVIAERIRTSIEAREFLRAQGLAVRISASFGISAYPDHGIVPEGLIQKADQAMYRVKERNKNGIEMAV